MRRGAWLVLVGVLLAGVLAGCGYENDDAPTGGPEPTSETPTGIRTIFLTPTPLPPPTGELYADMRQSSIDASLARMQVWVRNDTVDDVRPTAIRYRDERLPDVLLGERLRTDPARSERGFPLALPRDLDCDSDAARDPFALEGSGTVEVVTADGVETIPVEDETDVVGRYVAARCEEIALAEVASLAWNERVVVDRSTDPPVATLELVVTPSGVPGRELVVDGVAGSHLLQSAEEPPVWAPDVTVASDGPVVRVPLPLEPARCDPHAFMEGGGATAFRVRFHLDGEPGEVLLRMTPPGAQAALGFAREACGLP